MLCFPSKNLVNEGRHAFDTFPWWLVANVKFFVIKHINEHIKQRFEIVSATELLEAQLAFASKQDIAFKLGQALLFWDVLVAFLFNILLGVAKVYEVDLGISIWASMGVDHDVLRLEIFKCPLGAVDVLEDADQLYSDMKNLFQFIYSRKSI